MEKIRNIKETMKKVLYLNDFEDENVIKYRPWNRKDFFRRLRTFSSDKWGLKPPFLSPPNCAAYGWTNPAIDLLQCEMCGLTSFNPSSPTELIHLSGCAWRISGCSPRINTIVKTEQSPVSFFYTRLKDLKTINIRSNKLFEEEDLTPIDKEVLFVIKKKGFESNKREIFISLYFWVIEKNFFFCNFCGKKEKNFNSPKEVKEKHEWYCCVSSENHKQSILLCNLIKKNLEN